MSVIAEEANTHVITSQRPLKATQGHGKLSSQGATYMFTGRPPPAARRGSPGIAGSPRAHSPVGRIADGSLTRRCRRAGARGREAVPPGRRREPHQDGSVAGNRQARFSEPDPPGPRQHSHRLAGRRFQSPQRREQWRPQAPPLTKRATPIPAPSALGKRPQVRTADVSRFPGGSPDDVSRESPGRFRSPGKSCGTRHLMIDCPHLLPVHPFMVRTEFVIESLVDIREELCPAATTARLHSR